MVRRSGFISLLFSLLFTGAAAAAFLYYGAVLLLVNGVETMPETPSQVEYR